MLEHHAQDALRTQHPHTRRFEQLIDSIDPRIRADGHWPQLAARLAQAATSRPDLPTLVRAAATAQPLPDELPAAALWWRLSAELTSKATLDTPHTALRPTWITDLHNVFGSAAAEAIIADPAWPGLVSAVNAADPTRWTPADLLNVAAEHLADIDPDHTIPTYQYARTITYTVDLFAGHHDHTDPTIPEQAPLHPEDEEQFPPDPQHPRIDMPATDLSTTQWNPESVAPDPLDEILDSADELGGLDFADLPRQRVEPPPLPDALLNVHTLRTQYQQALGRLHQIVPAPRSATDPPMREAPPQISELRHRADADRPYLLAVQDVTAQWADAEADYDAALAQVEWARARLAELQAQARRRPTRHRLRRTRCPPAPLGPTTISPAERFQPAPARRTRCPRRRGRWRRTHRQRRRRRQVHRRRPASTTTSTSLQRAATAASCAATSTAPNSTTAAAFAAAEIRSAEHITAQLDELDTELRVLQAASRYQPQRPLPDDSQLRHRPAPGRRNSPHQHRRTAVCRHRPRRRTLTPSAQPPCEPCTTQQPPPTETSCGAAPLRNRPTRPSPTTSRPPPRPSPKPTPRSPVATPRCRPEH